MFFDEPQIKILTEQLAARLRRLKGITSDIVLLEQFDQRLNIFDNSTQGLNNRRIFTEAVVGEYREPLQILIKTYRQAYKDTVKSPYGKGDLVKN